MKKVLLQNVKIAIFGILTLLLLVLTVLELVPNQSTVITVKEPIAVSSVLVDTEKGIYENAISGMIFNDSEHTVTVDSVTVTVSNREQDANVQIPLSLTMIPHAQEEILFSKLDFHAFTHVDAVTAEINGDTHSLSNVQDNVIGASALILIALLLIFGFLLYRSILVRYYMYEEKKLKDQK